MRPNERQPETASSEFRAVIDESDVDQNDAESAMRRLDDVADNLIPSAEPAVAFSSLAEACVPLLGTLCSVDLVEDTGASYRIERPRIRTVLDYSCGMEVLAVSAAATVPSTARAAAGSSGYHAHVTLYCSIEHPADQVYLLQHLVDFTVELVRTERIQAALDDEHAHSAQLRQALEGSREIGMAVGILMNASNLNGTQAFAALRTVSQHTNRKLRDVAAELVATGSMPAPASAVERSTEV